MNKYKYIFVVLVYKNTDVLKSFFESLALVSDYRVILVNSFYDEKSRQECEEYAKEYSADFIDIPNLGYGEGNNKGIEFAKKNYSFEYLIVSNSDIIIKQFNDLTSYRDCIIAPETKMLSGKKQNPNMPYNALGLCYFLLKIGFKYNLYYSCRIAHAINKLNRLFFSLYTKFIKQDSYTIYSAHGSFFVIGDKALGILSPLFDSEMFLYNEELYLAINAKIKGIKVKYAPELIKVLHLEGASAGFDYKKQFPVHGKSFLILDRKVKLLKK